MLAALPSDPLMKKFGPKITLAKIISALLPYIFGIGGFTVLAFLIVGGYKYMMSKGDPKAVSEASQTITYAILGFIIMIGAYFVTNLIGVTLDLGKITSIFN